MRNRFERVIAILKLLSSGVPYNPMQLAQETGANRRTIFRDISTLKSLGIPLYFDEVQGVYSLGETQSRRNWVFQLVESLQTLDQNGFGTAFDFHTRDGRESFVRKLTEALPPVVTEELWKHLAGLKEPEKKTAEFIDFHGWISTCVSASRAGKSFSFKVVDLEGNKSSQLLTPMRFTVSRDSCRVECKNAANEELILEAISPIDLSTEPEFHIFSKALRVSNTNVLDGAVVSNGRLRH
jgi:predicted DNA-binding transcriptional regulator YafY